MSHDNYANTQFLSIKQSLHQLVCPPEEALHDLLRLMTSRKLNNGDYFLKAGQPSSELAFINAGLCRFYYQTRDGKEFNKSFATENHFMGAYSAYLTKQPARFSIQALEVCYLLVCQLSDIVALFDQHSCWQRLGRLLAEQLFIKKETREAEFLLDDAETRYLSFQKHFPGLEDRLTQYHVASYLGITPVALSRIRHRQSID